MHRFRLFVAIGSVLVTMTGCTAALVNRLAFHPDRTLTGHPDTDVESMEEVRIHTADGEALQAFFLRNDRSDKVVLFLHGNAGNAYHRMPDAVRLSEVGCSVLLLSYRGYGKSTGSPTESGVYHDAEAALDHLDSRLGFRPEDTFIFGRSIGSAVAVHVSQARALAGLILVTPLSSGRDMARHLGLGWWPMPDSPFDSSSKIGNVDAPLLVIHGDQDQVVPWRLGRKLFDAHPGPKRFVTVPGADHNDLVVIAGPAFWSWIRDFVEAPDAV